MWGSLSAVEGECRLGVLLGPGAWTLCTGAGDGSLVAPVILASAAPEPGLRADVDVVSAA